MSARSKSAGNSIPPEPESFEAAIEELEKLIQAMESGQLALEASVANYERGLQLLRYCQHRLDNVEQRIQVLEDDTLKPYTDSSAKPRGDAGTE